MGEVCVVAASGACACGGEREALLKPLLAQGRVVRDLPPPRTVREYVLDQASRVSLDTLRRSGERADF